MSELFKLNVTLRGPERSYESSYGPRTERDTLAQLDVPVSGERAWAIYQEALLGIFKPDFIVTTRDIPTRLITDLGLNDRADGEVS